MDTMHVDRNGQKVLINTKDYDPKTEKKWDDAPVVKPKTLSRKTDK